MTDTYIWKYMKKRFYAMSRKKFNKEIQDWEIVEFPYFIKDDDGKIENVVEPNMTLERPSDDLWFEIFPLHSMPRQQELGTAGRNRWIFGLQININCSRTGGYGTDDIDEAYDFIAGCFKRGDIFDGIRVLRTAYRSSARLLDDYYSVPVTVMVQADLKN